MWAHPPSRVPYRVGVAAVKRSSAAATRVRIIDAAAALLEDGSVAGLTVSGIMEQAGVSRTAFYRQFDDVYDVVAELVELVSAELFAQAGDWFDEVGAPGTRESIWENALRDGRSIKPRITLLSAISDARGLDESVATLWRNSVIQPWIDATAAGIRRDQAAGAIRPNLDPDGTALALTLMGEQLALEMLGRRNCQPEEYASTLAPIWEAVLFGPRDADRP